jgi:hypothetical protein
VLKEFAWRTFESTGSINAYVFYKEIELKNRLDTESEFAEEEVAISNNLG